MAYHGLFNSKAILVEQKQWYYLTHSWEDEKGSYLYQVYYSESDWSSNLLTLRLTKKGIINGQE